jgi:7-cyano-7-deazaguanine reductase
MSAIETDSDKRLSIRDCLGTSTNPNLKIDYLTSLKQTVNRNLSISLTYVPDKLLLRPECFLAYLDATSGQLHEPFEAYAHTFLDDFNNEVVPRWVRVEIFQPSGDTPGRRIILVDQQPRWQNPTLLSPHLY